MKDLTALSPGLLRGAAYKWQFSVFLEKMDMYQLFLRFKIKECIKLNSQLARIGVN